MFAEQATSSHETCLGKATRARAWLEEVGQANQIEGFTGSMDGAALEYIQPLGAGGLLVAAKGKYAPSLSFPFEQPIQLTMGL